jgi:hypothetical protein
LSVKQLTRQTSFLLVCVALHTLLSGTRTTRSELSVTSVSGERGRRPGAADSGSFGQRQQRWITSLISPQRRRKYGEKCPLGGVHRSAGRPVSTGCLASNRFQCLNVYDHHRPYEMTIPASEAMTMMSSQPVPRSLNASRNPATVSTTPAHSQNTKRIRSSARKADQYETPNQTSRRMTSIPRARRQTPVTRRHRPID